MTKTILFPILKLDHWNLLFGACDLVFPYGYSLCALRHAIFSVGRLKYTLWAFYNSPNGKT
jgi:hypothetical protein